MAVANALAAVALHVGALRAPPTIERADLVPIVVTTGALLVLALTPFRFGIRRQRRLGESKWPGGWRTPAIVALFAYALAQLLWTTASLDSARRELRVYSSFLLVFAGMLALGLLPRLAPNRDR